MLEHQEALSHLSPVWTHATPILVERAHGANLYDNQGVRVPRFHLRDRGDQYGSLPPQGG